MRCIWGPLTWALTQLSWNDLNKFLFYPLLINCYKSHPPPDESLRNFISLALKSLNFPKIFLKINKKNVNGDSYCAGRLACRRRRAGQCCSWGWRSWCPWSQLRILTFPTGFSGLLLFWDKNIIFWSHLFCKVYRDVRGPSYASWHPQLGFWTLLFWIKV